VATNIPLQGITQKPSRKSLHVEGSSAICVAAGNELRLIKITPCGDCEQGVAQRESPSSPQPWLTIFDPAFLEAIVDLHRRSYSIG
jgi:hypothetical protein